MEELQQDKGPEEVKVEASEPEATGGGKKKKNKKKKEKKEEVNKDDGY